MIRSIYDRKGRVLGRCGACGRLNYVEPHGTTAKCRCSAEWTEHTNIPYSARCGFGSDRVDTQRLPKFTSKGH